MIYARQPTTDELHELQRMRRQEVGRVSQRAHLVLLSIEHHSVPEIAELFQTTRVTVRFWIKRFNRGGPPGLYDQPRSGRPRKVVEEIQRTLNVLVKDDPQQEGYLATFWTVAMFLAVLA